MVKKVYSVWVDGQEVNDEYLTKKEADELFNDYVEKGYNPIIRKEVD